MDLAPKWSIHCINYFEPTLWVAVLASVGIGWFLGRTLARIFFSTRDRVRRYLYVGVAILLTGASMFLLPILAATYLYPLVHGSSRRVCLHFVQPALFLPFAVWSVTVVFEAIRTRAKEAKYETNSSYR